MPRWAGTEKYILDLVPLLLARGHDVVIACQPESEIEKRAKSAGFQVVHLTMRHTQDWVQFPRFARAMAGFDAVNIHSYVDYIVPAAAARAARVPAKVMTRHLPHPFRSRATAFLCSRFFYDRIIAVSNYVASVMQNSGVSPERIVTVKNGFDPTPWANAGPSAIRSQLAIRPQSFLLAAAGRLAPGKGFDVLLRAVGLLRRQGLDATCIIAGGGDPRELEAIREQEGLQNSAWLLGFRRDLPELYAAADAVVVPSASPETFGYGAVEGMASAKPVIASRIGGIPEIITPECGILVSPGDVDALSSAIRTLAGDPGLRALLATKARQRAREFPLDSWVEGVERVYRQILSAKRGE